MVKFGSVEQSTTASQQFKEIRPVLVRRLQAQTQTETVTVYLLISISGRLIRCCSVGLNDDKGLSRRVTLVSQDILKLRETKYLIC